MAFIVGLVVGVVVGYVFKNQIGKLLAKVGLKKE